MMATILYIPYIMVNRLTLYYFPKNIFKILNSQGQKGCKKVLKKYPEDAVGIQCNSDEVIVDCDNRDDYFSIKKKLLNNVQT